MGAILKLKINEYQKIKDAGKHYDLNIIGTKDGYEVECPNNRTAKEIKKILEG